MIDEEYGIGGLLVGTGFTNIKYGAKSALVGASDFALF